MSKGLEALDGLRFDVSMSQDIKYIEANKECDIIEKELKALEIIKKKEVNVNTLINCIIGAIEPLEFYNEKVSANLKLTQQEYDLLKEVLEND